MGHTGVILVIPKNSSKISTGTYRTKLNLCVFSCEILAKKKQFLHLIFHKKCWKTETQNRNEFMNFLFQRKKTFQDQSYIFSKHFRVYIGYPMNPNI